MAKYLKPFIKAVEMGLDGRPQGWLVGKTGISKSKISRLLAGENEPGLSDFIQISEALKIEPDILIQKVTGRIANKAYRGADFASELQALLAESKLPPELRAVIQALATSDSSHLKEHIHASQLSAVQELLRMLLELLRGAV